MINYAMYLSMVTICWTENSSCEDHVWWDKIKNLHDITTLTI